VISDGPYARVRHPGYAFGLLALLAQPIALGSLVALLPALVGAGLIALRAVREERTLARDLAGYADYVRRVRWRLLPGVW
jgi:protein-S-isoprenylcysteine O-methyltransferase Ste14